MFRLSKGAEYAIRGVLHLSMQREGKVSYIEEIAEAQDVPKAYLAKIFQSLSRKGILHSTRGQGGGFQLVKEPEELTVIEVIEAMEGPLHLNDCLIEVGYCKRENLCPVHDLWQDAQSSFVRILTECSFARLAEAAYEKRKNLDKKRSSAG